MLGVFARAEGVSRQARARQERSWREHVSSFSLIVGAHDTAM